MVSIFSVCFDFPGWPHFLAGSSLSWSCQDNHLCLQAAILSSRLSHWKEKGLLTNSSRKCPRCLRGQMWRGSPSLTPWLLSCVISWPAGSAAPHTHREQGLEDRVPLPKGGGPDQGYEKRSTDTLLTVWRTSCLILQDKGFFGRQ